MSLRPTPSRATGGRILVASLASVAWLALGQQAHAETVPSHERHVGPALLDASLETYACPSPYAEPTNSKPRPAEPVLLEPNAGGVRVVNVVQRSRDGVTYWHETTRYQGLTFAGSDGETYRAIYTVNAWYEYPLTHPVERRDYRADIKLRFVGDRGLLGDVSWAVGPIDGDLAVTVSGSCYWYEP